MKIEKQITRPVTTITDITCDSCGESCLPKQMLGEMFDEGSTGDQLPPDFKDDATSVAEYLTIKGEWGFFSNKDSERWEAHICEKCVDEKLSFIKFKKTDYTNE